ncbi:MAG: hypothetical protein R2824_06145 [Saprospiraceae bacterium]
MNPLNIQQDPIVTKVNIHNTESQIITIKAQTSLLRGLIDALKSE